MRKIPSVLFACVILLFVVGGLIHQKKRHRPHDLTKTFDFDALFQEQPLSEKFF